MPERRTVHLQLYIRIGCHLCEDMACGLQRLLDERSDDIEVRVDSIDIDEDGTLKQRFDTIVPVLMMAESILCETFLDPAAVSEALDQLTGRTDETL